MATNSLGSQASRGASSFLKKSFQLFSSNCSIAFSYFFFFWSEQHGDWSGDKILDHMHRDHGNQSQHKQGHPQDQRLQNQYLIISNINFFAYTAILVSSIVKFQ